MIYPIYVIHDALVGYQNPTIMNNDAFALRSFSETFSDVKNPGDYSLYRIGSFDTDTGELIVEPHCVIARATDFVKGDKDGENK